MVHLSNTIQAEIAGFGSCLSDQGGEINYEIRIYREVANMMKAFE